MTRYDPHPQAHDDARTGPQVSREAAGRDETAPGAHGDARASTGLREALGELADEFDRFEANRLSDARRPGEADRVAVDRSAALTWNLAASQLRSVLAAHPADAPEAPEPRLVPDWVRDGIERQINAPSVFERLTQAPEPSEDVVERAAQTISGNIYGTSSAALEVCRKIARVLADAGLLVDPEVSERAERLPRLYRDLDGMRLLRDEAVGERDRARATAVALEQEVARLTEELDAWRSGRRRRARPSHPAVPDAIGTAAMLARAQTGEDERLDSILREGAATITALRDGYGVAAAERDEARARVADLEAEVERWTEKAQEAGKAYADANTKHHEELDRANRLERLANTLAERAVDLEDGKRAAEARARRAEDALRRMTATARCVLGDNRIESDADLGNYPDPNLAELWLDVKHADRALAYQTSDATPSDTTTEGA